MGSFEEAKKILNSKQGKALLDVIAFTEGTAGVGQNGYDIVVSFKQIVEWNPNYTYGHADGNWYQKSADSTAAGRYQFLGSTWKSISKKLLGVDNAPFNKKNQDLFGAYLIYKRTSSTQKFTKGKYAGITIPKPPALTSLNQNNFYLLLDSLAPEWASFPFSQNGGKGFYAGQNQDPKKNNAAKLWSLYQKALAKY